MAEPEDEVTPAPGVARTSTPAELDELPDDGLRYELVDGNLATPGLPLEDDLRVPDVVVHRWLLQASTIDPANPLGPVDVGLLVEVVSPRTRKVDRAMTPGEYATAGVRVFWPLETVPEFVAHPFGLTGCTYAAARAVTVSGGCRSSNSSGQPARQHGTVRA